jgi:hypothetical protein
MLVSFCHFCQCDTRFLPIHKAVTAAGVGRSTIYRWMDRDWIHWKELASGRRVICQESLVRSVAGASPAFSRKQKLSETIP